MNLNYKIIMGKYLVLLDMFTFFPCPPMFLKQSVFCLIHEFITIEKMFLVQIHFHYKSLHSKVRSSYDKHEGGLLDCEIIRKRKSVGFVYYENT